MAREKRVSILGSAYFQPIADLLGCWLSRPRPPRPNKVGSGYYEHAYAAAVILLLVAMFESYISRLRFVQRSHQAANARQALDVIFGLYPNLTFKRALTDVYVVRDSIFHNHLWEIEFSWSGSPSTIFHGAVLDPAYGDSKYRARVNPQTRRTKALGINIVPTRVDRRDTLKVFKTVWKTLLFLESKDRRQCYVSHQHIRYQHKSLLFGELQNKLGSAL